MFDSFIISVTDCCSDVIIALFLSCVPYRGRADQPRRELDRHFRSVHRQHLLLQPTDTRHSGAIYGNTTRWISHWFTENKHDGFCTENWRIFTQNDWFFTENWRNFTQNNWFCLKIGGLLYWKWLILSLSGRPVFCRNEDSSVENEDSSVEHGNFVAGPGARVRFSIDFHCFSTVFRLFCDWLGLPILRAQSTWWESSRRRGGRELDTIPVNGKMPGKQGFASDILGFVFKRD